MEDNTFKEKIAKVLSNILNKDSSQFELTDNTDLMDDLGLNSLDFLQFIIQLENEFDIEIDIEKLEIQYFKKLSLLKSFITDTLAKKDVA